MNKNEFLKELKKRLKNLTTVDTAKSLEFYSEMIDDRMEDGMSEEEAIDSLGSIDDIAEQIKTSQSFDLPKSTNRKISWFNVVIFICASPIWLGLFGVYLSLWVFIASFYICDLTFLLSGIEGIAVFPLNISHAPSAFFTLGVSVFLLGLSVITFFGVNFISKQYIKLSKQIIIITGNFLTKEVV